MSRARASWAAFVAVMLLAGGVLLLDLGAGEWRTWDEGLYGRLARNALEHGRYLYAIDESGELYPRFSKPPMSLWLSALSLRALGMSVGALRLPFALGMLATVGFAFGWGRRIGGLPMAVTWSVGLATCAAATRWGRHACIEPMFIAGLLGGLWAYHAAMVAEETQLARRHAALAGLAFAFALLTKQLAVGMVLLPILVLELWRRDAAALPRLALALGIPTLVGVVWFAWAGAATDGAVFDILLDRGVRERMAGFAGGQNARTLNELSSTVSEACDPIPWALGAAGLALLCVARPREELRRPSPELLLPLWFASNVLVLDNASSSLLPWYALQVVVPVVGGAAWLVAATLRRPERAPLHGVRAALGWLCVGLIGISAAQPLASQFNVAILGALLLVAGFVWSPGAARMTAVLASALLMIGARMRDPELSPPDQAFSPLMEVLADASRVAVDRKTGLPQLASLALFGPHAEEVARAPWPTDVYDAYVVPLVVPEEYSPPPGMTLHRTAGVSTFVGDLSQVAWTAETMGTLLERGPVTFEAEHLAAGGRNTTFEDPGASGGALRRYALFRNETPPKIPLSIGPKIRLPAGRYTLELWMRWSCPEGSQRSAAAVAASTDVRELLREDLACKDGPETLSPVRFAFELLGAETFNMRIGFRYGVVEHDRTVLTWQPSREKT